jgi:hypothetical protein
MSRLCNSFAIIAGRRASPPARSTIRITRFDGELVAGHPLEESAKMCGPVHAPMPSHGLEIMSPLRWLLSESLYNLETITSRLAGDVIYARISSFKGKPMPISVIRLGP